MELLQMNEIPVSPGATALNSPAELKMPPGYLS